MVIYAITHDARFVLLLTVSSSVGTSGCSVAMGEASVKKASIASGRVRDVSAVEVASDGLARCLVAGQLEEQAEPACLYLYFDIEIVRGSVK